MNRRRTIAPRLKTSVWLALSLFLLAQAAAQWHMVAELHYACVAHGELVDSEETHSSESHPTPDSDKSPGADSSAPQPKTADHHCAIAASLHQPARQEVSPSVQGVLTVAPPSRMPAVLAILPPQVALFRIAPKNSPPSA